MKVPKPEINPISGRTRDEEIKIALGIGGRLPFDAWLSLKRRGVVGKRRQILRSSKAKRKSATKSPPLLMVPTGEGDWLKGRSEKPAPKF